MPARNEPTRIAIVALSKQELIVNAAQKLFLSASYAEISMDAIAAEAGVSKATVYSHFQNKEALFAGVMHKMCEESSGPKVSDGLAGPPEDVLRTVGLAVTHKLLEPDFISLLRAVLGGVSQFPELGRTYWEEGPGYARQMLTTYMTELNRRGDLNVIDPELAAMQFIGLITGPFLLPQLLGAQKRPTQVEIDRTVDRAVAVFLAGMRWKPD